MSADLTLGYQHLGGDNWRCSCRLRRLGHDDFLYVGEGTSQDMALHELLDSMACDLATALDEVARLSSVGA